MKEHDLQYLIEMNRVTRLIHKACMLTRQRSTVDYSDSYVIKDYELAKLGAKQNSLYEGKTQWTADEVMDGFDPMRNEWDRRLLYEVTGIQLNPGEFGDISDDDDDSVKWNKAFTAINAEELYEEVDQDTDDPPGKRRKTTRPWAHSFGRD